MGYATVMSSSASPLLIVCLLMFPYALLVCHGIGDYVLQSHTMAIFKTASWLWACIHAAFYAVPFALLFALLGALFSGMGAHAWLPLSVALAVIAGTHALIDRYRMAGYWCRWYGVGFPGIWASKDGFKMPPLHIGDWLSIFADNVLHLTINGLAASVALWWIFTF